MWYNIYRTEESLKPKRKAEREIKIMVLYETNMMFRKEEFTALLNKIGVRAEVADNGVLFNAEDFKAIKWASAPHWVYMNREFMKRSL